LAETLALVLEDGFMVLGERGGRAAEAEGEVVFNTCMSGYQEVLSDPSYACLLYTSPSPRDLSTSRMPSSA